MRDDERIAMLDRMRRMKAREEAEQTKKTQQEEGLTLKEALQGIEAGKLMLWDKTILEFETRTYFEEKMPFTIFKNFYQASQETAEGLILVNHDKNVSQIMSWNQEKRKAVTLNQWANLLVNGMAANHMYAKITKKAEIEGIEYLCFEVPARDQIVWNIMFRFKDRYIGVNGNYNCLKEDAKSYGVCLEAMVAHLAGQVMRREGEKNA